ncbi:hypothetical protein GCM10023148_47830 [Actinokineospora soli]
MRVLAAAMAVTLLATTLATVAPEPAAASTGPSVPLPGTPSTPVTRQVVSPRPDDEVKGKALSGNQAAEAVGEGAGNLSATPLSPSAEWSVGPHTGEFTWTYPLRLPPAPGGSEPALALSYNSSTVDGRTSATNNQASWVGDGWSLDAGFVERTYGACAADTDGVDPGRVGDLCWRTNNATANYPGGGGPLIEEAGSRWRAKSDDGSRIERLTGAANGDDDGEHWKITTVDGTQYFFGTTATSAWKVPVFGDDAGEPCHASTFAASHCAQTWRWNLDKVVDRHGDTTLYHYAPETNSYGLNLKDTAVSYTRSGHLTRIEYGVRAGVAATGRVDFTVADRCVPGSECTPQRPENWPDVPWDSKCDTATCADKHHPSFWTTKRLAKVTASVRDGAAYTPVDSWTLEHQYPDPGDGEKAALWLRSIVHTGHIGGTAALPPVVFEGTAMNNRVSTAAGLAPINRFRVTGVVSETGGVLSVDYADPDCLAPPAKAEENTLRCFPAHWAKKDYAERLDWFHKYVVASVVQSDRISGSPEDVTSYEYVGGAAWHHDTSEFTKADKKSWSEYRGYGRVRTTRGKADDRSGPVTRTEAVYYRGMHGDKLPSGTRTATVTDSAGGVAEDSDWLAGFRRESLVLNGDAVVVKEVTEPVWQGPSAHRGDLRSYLVRPGTVTTRTAVGSGWRTTRTVTAYDDRGLAERVDDLGDTATAADDLCTRTTYARNTDLWLLSYPSKVETVSVACGTAPTYPADAVSAKRTAYDGRAFGDPPSRGDATRVEVLAERPASGEVWAPSSSAEYDAHGRATRAADALDRATTTAYTPVTGGPTTRTVVTDALGHAVTTDHLTANGAVTKSVDANDRVTERAYDPLGRLLEVWLPNRPRASGDGNARHAYRIRNDGASVVTTSTLGPKGTYKTTKTLYDGLLRPRQTQAPAWGGGRLITDTRYDTQGRPHRTTQPYFTDTPLDDELWVAADAAVAGLTKSDRSHVVL